MSILLFADSIHFKFYHLFSFEMSFSVSLQFCHLQIHLTFFFLLQILIVFILLLVKPKISVQILKHGHILSFILLNLR